MGFKVTTVHNVPADNLDYYIYVVENSISNKYSQWFNDNFYSIGEELGEHAAIVQGHDDRLTREIMDILYEHGEPQETAHKFVEMFWGMVCLIISDGPITGGKSNVVIIPLACGDIDEACSQDDLFFITNLMSEILKNIKAGNIDRLVEKLGLAQSSITVNQRSWYVSTLEYINEYFELKPNIAGVGVDINAAIKKVIR